MSNQYDAILVLSFGGPEGMDDVLPFLENVLRGRNVPRERMIEVSHHYKLFDGVSPINAQNRALIAALESELNANDISLPIYFGNRNWHPLLPDTITQMAEDGVTSVLTFFTSMYSSYSGCRQYRENLYTACEEAKSRTDNPIPTFDKIRMAYNHPDFIAANADLLRQALDQIPAERRATTQIAFTAHSIPNGMAQNSRYEEQLKETSRLVAEAVGHEKWKLVYQSRSGPPTQPWLEPDICDYLEMLQSEGVQDVIIAPVGFISDHMEVLFDLDTEAREVCDELGLNMVRAASVGTHPTFVRMIRKLIEERQSENADRSAIGRFGPNHDVCPPNCCMSGRPGEPKPSLAQVDLTRA